MPHSTFFSTTPPPIAEAKPLPPVRNITTSHVDSLKYSPRTPIKVPPPLSPNRFFLTRGHGRSKSESATMNFLPTSFAPSSPTLTPRRRSREYAPPLLRSASLPLVIPEGRKSPSLLMTPATPTTPPPHRPVFLGGIPRCASPTRVYASSLSPAGIRSGYYPGSSFSPRAPSPPSYLVNETVYPGSASSSSPSTPTSLRSRSPSISSLETIPDTPDAEQAAVEAELKEALARKSVKMENDDDEDNGFGRRRRSMDFDRGGARWGAVDKRKRWSVCGGEKRGDLDLETIWEEALNIAAEANHSIIRRDEVEDQDEGEEEDDDDNDDDDDDDENEDIIGEED